MARLPKYNKSNYCTHGDLPHSSYPLPHPVRECHTTTNTGCCVTIPKTTLVPVDMLTQICKVTRNHMTIPRNSYTSYDNLKKTGHCQKANINRHQLCDPYQAICPVYISTYNNRHSCAPLSLHISTLKIHSSWAITSHTDCSPENVSCKYTNPWCCNSNITLLPP